MSFHDHFNRSRPDLVVPGVRAMAEFERRSGVGSWQIALDQHSEHSPQTHERDGESQHGKRRDQKLGGGLPPQIWLDRFLGQSQHALDQMIELASRLGNGQKPDRFLVADPEDICSDETILAIEYVEPAYDLLQGVRCALGQLFEGVAATHQKQPLFALEIA